jgi:hypothetical protein
VSGDLRGQAGISEHSVNDGDRIAGLIRHAAVECAIMFGRIHRSVGTQDLRADAVALALCEWLHNAIESAFKRVQGRGIHAARDVGAQQGVQAIRIDHIGVAGSRERIHESRVSGANTPVIKDEIYKSCDDRGDPRLCY